MLLDYNSNKSSQIVFLDTKMICILKTTYNITKVSIFILQTNNKQKPILGTYE